MEKVSPIFPFCYFWRSVNVKTSENEPNVIFIEISLGRNFLCFNWFNITAILGYYLFTQFRESRFHKPRTTSIAIIDITFWRRVWFYRLVLLLYDPCREKVLISNVKLSAARFSFKSHLSFDVATNMIARRMWKVADSPTSLCRCRRKWIRDTFGMRSSCLPDVWFYREIDCFAESLSLTLFPFKFLLSQIFCIIYIFREMAITRLMSLKSIFVQVILKHCLCKLVLNKSRLYTLEINWKIII